MRMAELVLVPSRLYALDVAVDVAAVVTAPAFRLAVVVVMTDLKEPETALVIVVTVAVEVVP